MQRVVPLDDIVSDIGNRAPVGALRLVGVDGPAGSGKSTLARQLAALLAAPIASTDDFLSWTDLEGWWPRFESDLIAPLLAGRDATYLVRDWAGDAEGASVKQEKTTPFAPVVLVEGVTSTRSALADRLAYRIWVEAPEQLRHERALARDGDYWRPHWDSWQELESAFFAADGTRSRADLVIDSSRRPPAGCVIAID